MTVRDIIKELLEYNLDANISAIAHCKEYKFSLSCGGSEGVTKKNTNDVHVYIDELCTNERNNETLLKKDDDYYWNIIDVLGWGTKSVDYKELGKMLADKYPDDIKELQIFVEDRRKELIQIMDKYTNTLPGNKSYWGVSDDGFLDLTAHIVGLGKQKYLDIILNPCIAKDISSKQEYKENFEYIFHYTKK